MVKVTAPMLSLNASGTLANAITYSTWKGRSYVRTRVIPANPRSGLQVGMRAGITAAAALWRLQSTASKALWAALVGSEAISGFNYFTRVGQSNVRNDYSYCTDSADQDRSDTPAAPGDAAATQDGTDVDVTWTHVAAAITLMIFHSTSTGFTPGIVNLVAIVFSPDQTWTHRNPGVGTQYYDVRSAGADGGIGALEGEFNVLVA